MGALRYLIATPSDGECTVVASQDDNSLVPLGSVFKLWVKVAPPTHLLVHASGPAETCMRPSSWYTMARLSPATGRSEPCRNVVIRATIIV